MKTPTKKRQKAAVANLTKTRHTLSLHFGQQQTMAKCWWQVDKCRIINRNDDFVPKTREKISKNTPSQYQKQWKRVIAAELKRAYWWEET